MNAVPDNRSGHFDLYLPTTVGRILSGQPNKFTAWLREEKILYRKGKTLRASLRYENLGYLMYEGSGDSSECWEQVYFTGRGLEWITSIYRNTHKEEELHD